MAVYRDDIVDLNLESGTVFRSFACKCICEGDDSGNRYGMRLLRGGEVVDVSGCTVTGYFIRADQTSVIIGGSVSDNVAYVTLPKSCYVVPGNYSLAIKLTGGNATETMRIIDGTVLDTIVGSVVDPGSIVPDLSALMAVIERAEAAAADIAKFSVTEQLISGDNYRLIVEVTE